MPYKKIGKKIWYMYITHVNMTFPKIYFDVMRELFPDLSMSKAVRKILERDIEFRRTLSSLKKEYDVKND